MSSRSRDDQVKENQEEEIEEDSEIEEDEFVVEAIVSHKIRNKKVFYDVAWVGYDEHSWEPKSNLDGCPDKLQAYWDEIGGEPEPSAKKRPGRAAMQDNESPSKRRKLSSTESETRNSTTRNSGAKGRGRPAGKASKEPPGHKHTANNGETYLLPAGTWENVIDSITSVYENHDSGQTVLEAHALFKKQFDYQTFSFRAIVLHEKAPRKLLEYYEKNLTFKQPSQSEAESVTTDAVLGKMDMDDPHGEDPGNVSDVEDNGGDVGIKDVATA